MGLLRVLVEPLFGKTEHLGALALGHIHKQSPWGAAKTKQRHSSIQFRTGQSNGLERPVQRGQNVWLHLNARQVCGRTQWVHENWALPLDHFDLKAHGLWNHQNVREDNRSVDETVEMLNGLDGDFGSNLGITASLEKVSFSLHHMVFGQISACLALES